jgi:hypothetical protein
VLLGWLALEARGSPLFVGVVLGLRMLPMLVVGVPTGALADRGDATGIIVRAGLGLVSVELILAGLIGGGLLATWQLPFLALAIGTGHAVAQTARQSVAHVLAGDAALTNAYATLATGLRLGGVAGSLVAGALTARSPVMASMLLAGTHLLATLAARKARPPGESPARPPASRPTSSTMDALRAARAEPAFAWILILTAAVEILGFSYQALLPSLARDVLGVGAGGLGLLNAARSAGGLLATAGAAAYPAFAGTRRQLVLSVAIFGASLVALAIAPSLVTMVVAVLVLNGVASLTDVLSQTLATRALPPERRGQAGGAWVAAVGMSPLGQLQIGALALVVGVPWALALNGLGLVAVAAAGARWPPRSRPGAAGPAG